MSRDLEGISGGRGLIWRGDCVWWFLWFDWLKPLKNMFYFKASGPAKFYRSRSASQYSSPLRYIRYPQSSFETFACSIQTSSSGFHRARVIPLNNLLSVNSKTVAVRGFLIWGTFPIWITYQKKQETMSVWAGWSECEWWKKPHSANSATVGWIEVSFCREIGNVEIRSLKGQIRSKRSNEVIKVISNLR